MNLKELSNLLGLSQTTVSRALNGYPEVSELTRQKVQAAAQQHNYAPNTRARGLATGRTHAVAHVLSFSTEYEVVNPVFADFIAGASAVYAHANYDMVLSIVPDDEEANAYRTLATKGSVDGVILHAPKHDDPRIALLRDIGMPFVVHGRASSEDETSYNWVDMDNYDAFLKATKELTRLGHRRIGFLNGLERLEFAQNRRRGYRDALMAVGVSEDPALCFNAEMTEGFGYRSTLALLDTRPAPTAILASSILIGIGVRRALNEKGLRMGKDISVIVHDDDLSYLPNGDDKPIFTATRSPIRQAGQACAQMLMQQITNPESVPQQVLVATDLVLGPSIGPVPG